MYFCVLYGGAIYWWDFLGVQETDAIVKEHMNERPRGSLAAVMDWSWHAQTRLWTRLCLHVGWRQLLHPIPTESEQRPKRRSHTRVSLLLEWPLHCSIRVPPLCPLSLAVGLPGECNGTTDHEQSPPPDTVQLC